MGRLERPRGFRRPSALASRSREPAEIRELRAMGERGRGAKLAHAPGLFGARRTPERGRRELRAAHARDRGATLGRPVAAHRQHDIAGLLPGFDVRGRLDHLLQRVATIDHRPVLPRLDELLEEEDVLLRVLRYRERHLLVSDPAGQQGEYRNVPHEPGVGVDVDPARPHRASAAPERVLADCVEDDVVRLAVLGEVFLRVVDDLVGSERGHELEVLGVAHRRDVGAEVLGELHPCGADGPGRAVDEDPLPLPEICQSQTPQRVESPVADRRSLLEAHAGRLVRDSGALPHADELRVRPEPEPTAAEDVVTDRELVDGCANCFDLSGQLTAEDPLLRSAEATDDAAEKRDGQAATPVGFTSSAVRPGDRRGMDLDEYFVLFGDGPLDVFESQNVRRPVPVVDNCSHESLLLLSFGCERRIGLPCFQGWSNDGKAAVCLCSLVLRMGRPRYWWYRHDKRPPKRKDPIAPSSSQSISSLTALSKFCSWNFSIYISCDSCNGAFSLF